MTETPARYDCRTTQLTISRKEAPIFDESATRIEIDDEAAGEFIVITQSKSAGDGRITIDREEWPLIRRAIDSLIQVLRID